MGLFDKKKDDSFVLPSKLEMLLDIAVKNGEVSDKELSVLRVEAQKHGFSDDELEMIIESRMPWVNFSILRNKARGFAEIVSDATKEASESIANKTAEIKEKVADFRLEDITDNLNIYEKYFSESELWNKIAKIGKSIGAAIIYPVLLLFNLLMSSETDLKEKTMIIGALGYFILPLDLIPDAIPTAGFTDDMAALTAIISALASCVTLEMQNESKQKCHDLLGDIDDRAIIGITKVIEYAHNEINKKD